MSTKVLHNIAEIRMSEIVIGNTRLYAVYDEVSGIMIDHPDCFITDNEKVAMSVWRGELISKAIQIMTDSPDEARHILSELQKYI